MRYKRKIETEDECYPHQTHFVLKRKNNPFDLYATNEWWLGCNTWFCRVIEPLSPFGPYEIQTKY